MSDLITPAMAAEMRASLEALGLRTINLTADPVLRQKMDNKLDEYRDRVSRGEEGLRGICKASIMAVLQEQESVTPNSALTYLAVTYSQQASSELERLTQSGASQLEALEEFKDALRRAWNVINDYNETGGRHNRGGTGLKLGGIGAASPLPSRQ